MIISLEQLWHNLLLILILAFIIEVALSGLFSIKYLEDFLGIDKIDNIKAIIFVLIAFGLAMQIPQLRVLYKSSLKIPDLIHMIISALIVARVGSLFSKWIKSNSSN